MSELTERKKRELISFPPHFKFISLDDITKSYVVEDFIRFNNGDNQANIDFNQIEGARLKGDDNIVYTVETDLRSDIYDELDTISLYYIKNYIEVPEINSSGSDKEDEATEYLTLNASDYKRYLRVKLSKIEEVLYYTRLANKLHKEAVQNAVDIVQTKRIEFTKLPDQPEGISGMLLTAVNLVMFELGGATFILNQIFKAAVALAGSRVIQKVLDTMSVFAYRNSLQNSNWSTRKILETSINEFEVAFKHYDRQAIIAAKHGYLPNKKELYADFNESKAFVTQVRIELAKKSLVRKKREERSELIRLGKEQYAKFQASIEKKINENPDKVNNTFKAVGEKLTPLPSGSSITFNEVLPLDVYFKTLVQNQFDEPVRLIERVEMNLKKILSTLEQGTIYGASVQEKFVNELPTIEDLDEVIESYKNYFTADFDFVSAKNYMTVEYELTIWSLVLSNKFSEGLLGDGAKGIERFINWLATPFDVKTNAISEVMGNKFVNIDIPDYLVNYLATRFGVEVGLVAKNFVFDVGVLKKAVFRLLYFNFNEIQATIIQLNQELGSENQYKINTYNGLKKKGI